jgi:hypothetical protein
MEGNSMQGQREQPRRPATYWQRFGVRVGESWPLSICGLGIGFLVALSISPIAAHVILILVGLSAAVVAVLSGFRPSVKGRESATAPSPGWFAVLNSITVRGPHAVGVMLLVLGIVLGTMVGLLCRTHNVLGVDSPLPKSEASDSKASLARGTYLFDQPSPKDIERLQGATEIDIVRLARSCDSVVIRRLAETFQERPKTLLEICRALISPAAEGGR